MPFSLLAVILYIDRLLNELFFVILFLRTFLRLNNINHVSDIYMVDNVFSGNYFIAFVIFLPSSLVVKRNVILKLQSAAHR